MRRPRPEATALLVGALLAGRAHAVQIDDLQVAQNGSRYRLHMLVRLDADPARAYAVFADHRNLPRINPAVRSAQVLPVPAPLQDGSDERLRTELRVCVSWFCRTLVQVQDMRHEPAADGGTLGARVLPELSDLRYGRAHWRIWNCAPQAPACLSFEAELDPRFWIPPVIGPWLMERKLRAEAIQTSQGIERLAREAAGAAAITR